MSKAKLKKYMSALSKEQVVGIMLQLYDASKEASAWLEFYMEPNSDAELKNIRKQYVTNSLVAMTGPKIRVSENAIN